MEQKKIPAHDFLDQMVHGSFGKETCVMCHKMTDIDVNLSIEFRKCYVEGAGQLCDECWEKIYGEFH